jgi:HEAT repeat protein
LLKELGTEPKSVNNAVEKALGQIGAAAISPVAQALQSSEVRQRVSAARVLSMIPGPASVEPLIKALQDPDPGVRLEAARALGRVGDQRAVAPLEQAQQDPDEAVRKMARMSIMVMRAQDKVK